LDEADEAAAREKLGDKSSREAQIGSSSTVFTFGSKPLVYCYASANRGAHAKQKGKRHA
jgi:hypothetical protein